MLKPKSRPSRRYWESLSDNLLLDVDLTTDDPQHLSDLVTVIPAGEEEPYVEYAYDLRGRETDEMRCVHCHQLHKAGYVMKKNGQRFFVGHICGAKIYGEDFDKYEADYTAAVNRQQSLRRKREIDNATKPFMAWLEEISSSGVFDRYDSVVEQVHESMQWVAENVSYASFLDQRVTKVQLPRSLFQGETDPRGDFTKLATEIALFVMRLSADEELKTFSIHNIRIRFDGLLNRLEAIFDQLKEVDVFFSPEVLRVICDLANEHDKPKKRKYEPGLLAIICKREKGKVTTVQKPKNFRLPERAALDRFRAALLGISEQS